MLGAGGTARESKHFLPALHPLSVQEGRTELASCTLHLPEPSHPSAGTWAAGGMCQHQPARKVCPERQPCRCSNAVHSEYRALRGSHLVEGCLAGGWEPRPLSSGVHAAGGRGPSRPRFSRWYLQQLMPWALREPGSVWEERLHRGRWYFPILLVGDWAPPDHMAGKGWTERARGWAHPSGQAASGGPGG